MKKILIFLYSAAFVPVFFLQTSPAYAETHITGDTLFQNGTAWVKAGSPYILDDSVSISAGQSLYIGPGVTVIASSTEDNPVSIFTGGNLTINGTVEEPVTISGLDSVTVSRTSASIFHTIARLPNGISIFYGTTTIASSTIYSAAKAISVWGSLLDIRDSSIEGNEYGVYSYHVSPGPFLSFFAGTAMADTTVDPKQNRISISNSSIAGNHIYGIYNAIANTINAENNWWGDAAGPRTGTSTIGMGDIVYGPMDYTPWLRENPASSTPVVSSACCSNVLFLPGMEGSRLYDGTHELWVPNDNTDAENLFMDDTGKSIKPSIYAKDIVDSSFGVGIYKNFIAMMNGMVAGNTINAWEPFAYDWRYGADTIAESPKILSDFQSLASSSKTGKVTIVAHSDGGLVAKMLAKDLAEKGRGSLIDKVIMVAVPQLGTPLAIASLLHGDGQEILNNIVFSDVAARQLGDNSPGAYGLLPSKGYFDSAALSAWSPRSVISFSTSSLADFHMTGNVRTISTYDAFKAFLSGTADRRSQPASADTDLPAILHTAMLNNAQTVHDDIDDFSFASSTSLVSLIGVGDETLAGISYFEKKNCPVTNAYAAIFRPQPCAVSLEHAASTTFFGDGTVVDVSAKTVGKNFYFNLFGDNKGKIFSDSHANLLNNDSVTGFIKGQITDSFPGMPSQIPASPLPLPPYITDTEPTLADFPVDNLVITMHSPVDINVYDAQGRHTGPIPNPDPTSDIGLFETNIPDSRYTSSDTLGKAITVPYGPEYRIVLTGTGNGSFTLDTEHEKNTGMISQTEFADMPATPLLKAELLLATTTYATAAGPAGGTARAGTTTQLLVMDFDGDGITDATSTPGGAIDPTAYLRSMERTIKSFRLDPYREKTMCDKIDKIIAYIIAKKPIRVDEKSAKAAEQALGEAHNQHWIFKSLDQDKKDRLLGTYQSLLDSAEFP